MPHFILESSPAIYRSHSRQQTMLDIHDIAVQSKLFNPDDIKVRIHTYTDYLTAGSDAPFIHIFAHIMEGRTTEQKNALSHGVVCMLQEAFPDVPVISMNIYEFDRSTYHNLRTV